MSMLLFMVVKCVLFYILFLLESGHSRSISFIGMPVFELSGLFDIEKNIRKKRLAYIKLLLTCI